MIEYLTEIIIASVFTIPTIAFAWGSWGGGGVSGGGTGGFGAAGGSGSGSSGTNTSDTGGFGAAGVDSGGGDSQGSKTALQKAIEKSQSENPAAWAKATGTTNRESQLKIVTGNQKRISQQTLTTGITTYHYDGSIATQEQQWLRPEPSQDLLDAIAASQEKHPTAWANATGTTDKAKQAAKVTGGFTGAPVKITDVYGGEFQFLSEPAMPAKSIITQTEYNILFRDYGKETADQLATQTYLTRQEFQQQHPEFSGSATQTQQIIDTIQDEQKRIAQENRVHQTTRTAAPSTTTAPTPTYVYPPTPQPQPQPTPSSFSILPFVLVGVVLVGILIIIRRRK